MHSFEMDGLRRMLVLSMNLNTVTFVMVGMLLHHRSDDRRNGKGYLRLFERGVMRGGEAAGRVMAIM